ncbi:hypothetical protein TNCT_410921 [Trichonephila clavata]|uniref:DUF5641 domain-containing protein n=1 Tax=Trichonephila clavata TaxID=2740835 RepID=A0A8X6LUY0_TRICU|nr:hypothetical protein TNCT_410921 [Trichonephila clavata]
MFIESEERALGLLSGSAEATKTKLGTSNQISDKSYTESRKNVDPNFHISKPIGVLLGAEIYANLLEGLPILGPAGTPAAIPTKLGYILSRKIYAPPLQESIVNSTLNDQLSELWKLEEVPKTNAKIQIPDPCEESFSKSVKRNNEDWINNDLKEELSSAKILTTCTVEADSVLNSTPLVVESNPLEIIISKFSNFTKLIRVIALCKRYINNCKSGSKLRQHFWDRWHKEVLHHYQSRPNWKTSQSEVQVGNLVLISDDNRSPGSWQEY